MDEARVCSGCDNLVFRPEGSFDRDAVVLCSDCSAMEETSYSGGSGGAVQAAGCALFGTGYLAMGVLGLILHVWTIVLAYEASGLFAAMIALCLPVLAQLYWFFQVMSATGTIANTYCLAILGYLGLMAILFVIVTVVANDAE